MALSSRWFIIISALVVVLGSLGQSTLGVLLLLISLLYPPFSKFFFGYIKELNPQKNKLVMFSWMLVILAVLSTLIVATNDLNAWGTALGLAIIVLVVFNAGLVGRHTAGDLVWSFWVLGSVLATAFVFYDRYIRINHRAGLLVGCNAAGTLLLIALSVFIAMVFKETPQRRWIYAILALLSLFGVLLTVSRAAWVGMLALFLSLPFFGTKTKKLMIVVLCACLLLGILIYNIPFWRYRFSTIFSATGESSRINGYKAATKMMLKNPVGIGLSRFQAHYSAYISEEKELLSHAHNIYLQFGAELGPLGFLLSLFIYLSVPYMCYQIAKTKPYYGPIGAGFLAVAVRELFDCTTLGLSVAGFIWFFFGYICAEYIKTVSVERKTTKA